MRTERSAARTLSTVIIGLLLAGCSKTGEADKSTPVPSSSAEIAKPAASVAPTAAAKPSAAKGDSATYGGTYSVVPGKMYIPEAKDYAGVKQAKDDPSKHVGEGAVTLTVAPDGRVTGTIESGPASPALIDGTLTGADLRANVRRKAPTDDGLTGTLDAKIAGDAIEGTLSLAEATAAIVREGKLTLKKK